MAGYRCPNYLSRIGPAYVDLLLTDLNQVKFIGTEGLNREIQYTEGLIREIQYIIWVLQTVKRVILTTYWMQYLHPVPFLINKISYSLLKPPKTHAI